MAFHSEDFCTYYLPAKAFLGLGVTDVAPDHSTLSIFKLRLLKHGGSEAYAKLFETIIRQAQTSGVTFGKVQLVDAVYTVADVNPGCLLNQHPPGKNLPWQKPASRPAKPN